MLIASIIWLIFGFIGTKLIINAEYQDKFWEEVTVKELLKTTKWILLGPITLFLCFKWMYEEEGFVDKKVNDIFNNDEGC